MKKIVVGLSGGVDSSIAAFLLKKHYNVIGVYMRNWIDDSEEYSCNWITDSTDAMLVAEQLNIPFNIIDLSYQYKKKVFDHMISEYSKGNTPNPDIICNKKIKFNFFLEKAFSLGADGIATGHYINKDFIIKNGKKIFRLISPKDYNKNQSYFLCQLTQYQISKSLFPLGNLTKIKVRELANKLNLVTANKKDSQGICFIGKTKFKEFIKKRIPIKKGKIIEILSNNNIYYKKKYILKKTIIKKDILYLLSINIEYKENDGKLIGFHDGAHFFTKGQRKGIKIGGYKKSIFVIETDIINNIIYVGMGKDHPGLYKKVIFIKENKLHWIREDLKISIGNNINVYCQIRYRQPLQKAILYKFDYTGIYIEFLEYQVSITNGQYVVWYIDNEMIGSGII